MSNRYKSVIYKDVAWAALAGLGMLSCSAMGAAQASPVATVIYGCARGGSSATTCGVPSGELVRDQAGNFYGLSPDGESSSGTPTCEGTPQCVGNAFELVAPAAGQTQFTIRILHVFLADGSDGAFPQGAMIFDTSGNLYGTTLGGGAGNVGTVFELSPPAPGTTGWTETILHSFTTADGTSPGGTLLLGQDGSLYGVTQEAGAFNGGTVYRLGPSGRAGAPRRFSTLYAFSSHGSLYNPIGRLATDGSGVLYGVAEANKGFIGNGGVYRLLPAAGGGAVSLQVLHLFTGVPDASEPMAGVILDRLGNLYGTTASGGSGAGTAYELSPPSGQSTTWRETILHDFASTYDGYAPVCDLLLDASGNLYGTTSDGGTDYVGAIFELSPPASGQGAWAERLLSFNISDGSNPMSGLITGAPGELVGTVSNGINQAGGAYSVTQ